MPRPRKTKMVGYRPEITYFKPRALPLKDLDEVEVTLDELETLRLANIVKLSQVDAAVMMHVHQSTFNRTLLRAREKVTDALVNGKAIKIHGGEYKMPGGDATGPMGRGGRRFGRQGGFNAGPGGVCICTKCGYKMTHTRGEPCSQMKCPECQSSMTRR